MKWTCSNDLMMKFLNNMMLRRFWCSSSGCYSCCIVVFSKPFWGPWWTGFEESITQKIALSIAEQQCLNCCLNCVNVNWCSSITQPLKLQFHEITQKNHNIKISRKCMSIILLPWSIVPVFHQFLLYTEVNYLHAASFQKFHFFIGQTHSKVHVLEETVTKIIDEESWLTSWFCQSLSFTKMMIFC